MTVQNMAATQTPLLEVSNLNTWFATARGEIKAVDGVSFSLAPGEVLGLVGESGSGKSITGFSIIGLIDEPGRIVEGSSIKLEGRELVGLSAHELRAIRGKTISMVFQDPMMTLNPVLSIGTQIRLALEAHEKISAADARERAIKALRQVRISEPERKIDFFPHQFSGGMRQRIVIAICMALDPKLVVMDEPTTALDVVVQREILQRINELRRQFGFSVLFITHDLGLMVQFCDRIGIMLAGKLVEQNTAEAIYKTPQHDYTKKLWASFPSLHGGVLA